MEIRTEHTRGSIARPLTDDEVQDKVRALVTPVLGDGAADRIRDAVDNLPGAPDLTGLLTALRPSVEAPGLGVQRVQSAPESGTERRGVTPPAPCAHPYPGQRN